MTCNIVNLFKYFHIIILFGFIYFSCVTAEENESNPDELSDAIEDILIGDSIEENIEDEQSNETKKNNEEIKQIENEQEAQNDDELEKTINYEEMLLGKWILPIDLLSEYELELMGGGVLRIKLKVKNTNIYTSQASGTWEISENYFVGLITHSTITNLKKGHSWKDKIISINEKQLTLFNNHGQIEELYRK